MKISSRTLTALVKELTKEYAAAIEQLPLAQDKRRTLCDGFHDGAVTGARRVCDVLGVAVKDNAKLLEK